MLTIAYFTNTKEGFRLLEQVVGYNGPIPRMGEKVVMTDTEGIGQVYNVVELHYAFPNTNKLDIFLEHLATITDYMIELNGDYSY